MSGPTPGPWEIVDPPMGYVEIHGGIDGDANDDGTLRQISTHICDIIDNADEQGNARLIAAAPDLLAAAKRALNTFKAQGESVRSGNVLGALEAAIAKAEGRKP